MIKLAGEIFTATRALEENGCQGSLGWGFIAGDQGATGMPGSVARCHGAKREALDLSSSLACHFHIPPHHLPPLLLLHHTSQLPSSPHRLLPLLSSFLPSFIPSQQLLPHRISSITLLSLLYCIIYFPSLFPSSIPRDFIPLLMNFPSFHYTTKGNLGTRVCNEKEWVECGREDNE